MSWYRTGTRAKAPPGWRPHRNRGWGRRLRAKDDKPMRERRRARRRRNRLFLLVLSVLAALVVGSAAFSGL